MRTLNSLHLQPSSPLYPLLQQTKRQLASPLPHAATRTSSKVSEPPEATELGRLLYSYDRASEYSFQAELPFRRAQDGVTRMPVHMLLRNCTCAWQGGVDGDKLSSQYTR